jgi:hypothetical protein
VSSAEQSTAPGAGQRGADSGAAAEGNGGRLVLLLIAGIPVTIVLASTWLWYFVVNGELDIVGRLGTSNAGELLQPPRQALDAGWRYEAGAPFTLAEEPRWTLLIPLQGNSCDAACETQLFEVRQIHQLLGKELARVERTLVTTAGAGELAFTAPALSDDRPVPDSFADYVASEQRGLEVVHSEAGAFAAMFPERAVEPTSWYLMDPNGWVMMRYDASISYKDVISDLKFLLRNSNG